MPTCGVYDYLRLPMQAVPEISTLLRPPRGRNGHRTSVENEISTRVLDIRRDALRGS